MRKERIPVLSFFHFCNVLSWLCYFFSSRIISSKTTNVKNSEYIKIKHNQALQKRSLRRSEFIKPTSSRNYNIIWYLKPLSVSFLKEKVKDAAGSEARNVTSYITSLILKDLKKKELVK